MAELIGGLAGFEKVGPDTGGMLAGAVAALAAVSSRLDEAREAYKRKSDDDDGVSVMHRKAEEIREWLTSGPGAVDALAPERMVCEFFGRVLAELREQRDRCEVEIDKASRTVHTMTAAISEHLNVARNAREAVDLLREKISSAERLTAGNPVAVAVIAASLDARRAEVRGLLAVAERAEKAAKSGETQVVEANDLADRMRTVRGDAVRRMRIVTLEQQAEVDRLFPSRQELLEAQRLLRIELGKIERYLGRLKASSVHG